jgi:hypothetical protein
MKNLKDLMVPFELSEVLVSHGMIEPCAAVWNELQSSGKVDFLPKKFGMCNMLTFTPAYTHQQVKEWLVGQGFEIVVFPKFTTHLPGKKYGYAYQFLDMGTTDEDAINELSRGIFALYPTEEKALETAFAEALGVIIRHKEAPVTRLSKFSYGEEVGHAPDLYDMTRSKVDEITRSFKALHTGTDEFDEDGLVLRESEFDTISIPHSLNGDILEVTYPGRKHLGEPDRIVRYKLYGYSYVVTNDKMSGIYSEKGLYKI